MQLQPVTLELLCLYRFALDLPLLLRANRQPKDGQATVTLPEGADGAADAEARFGKAALVGLCVKRGACSRLSTSVMQAISGRGFRGVAGILFLIGTRWELSRNAWELSRNVWELSRNVWELGRNAWERWERVGTQSERVGTQSERVGTQFKLCSQRPKYRLSYKRSVFCHAERSVRGAKNLGIQFGDSSLRSE
jgi:hypothetical protein